MNSSFVISSKLLKDILTTLKLYTDNCSFLLCTDKLSTNLMNDNRSLVIRMELSSSEFHSFSVKKNQVFTLDITSTLAKIACNKSDTDKTEVQIFDDYVNITVSDNKRKLTHKVQMLNCEDEESIFDQEQRYVEFLEKYKNIEKLVVRTNLINEVSSQLKYYGDKLRMTVVSNKNITFYSQDNNNEFNLVVDKGDDDVVSLEKVDDIKFNFNKELFMTLNKTIKNAEHLYVTYEDSSSPIVFDFDYEEKVYFSLIFAGVNDDDDE